MPTPERNQSNVVAFTVRIPKPMLAELQQAADALDLSTAALIRLVVRDYLRRRHEPSVVAVNAAEAFKAIAPHG